MITLYESRDHILLCGDYSNPIYHSHMAAHMLISFAGTMRVITDAEEFWCSGVLIPSGVPHRVETDGLPVLVFLYDCTSSVARQIQRVRPILKEDCDIISQFYSQMKCNCSNDAYKRFEIACLDALGLSRATSMNLDGRICEAVAYIQQHCCDKVSCKDVADAVFLSQGRFSHLFREQVGMTFSAYLIYQRIICVYTNVIRGQSITEAAVAAGFSSSAHFADVNRRLFGITVSAITRDLIYLKVS